MVGEKRKNEACAVDGRARAARRTSCPSRLSGVSRVCRHQGSSALIFIEHHRVRRRRRRKGRGTPAGAKVTARSRRGGGRCGTMRWGSHGYKIGINERNRLSSGAFSISIMNLGAHRPATDEQTKRWRPAERMVGEAASHRWLLARNFERSHDNRTFVTMCSVLRTIYLRRVISDLSSRTEKAPRDADERPPA